jgi:hypothetical protein
MRHSSPHLPKNRRAREYQCTAHQNSDDIGLPRCKRLGRCSNQTQCRSICTRVTGLTRNAATRDKRGTVPRPIEIQSSLLPQPRKTPHKPAAPLGATVWRVPKKLRTSSDKTFVWVRIV